MRVYIYIYILRIPYTSIDLSTYTCQKFGFAQNSILRYKEIVARFGINIFFCI